LAFINRNKQGSHKKKFKFANQDIQSFSPTPVLQESEHVASTFLFRHLLNVPKLLLVDLSVLTHSTITKDLQNRHEKIEDTEEFAFKTMYSFIGGMVGLDKGATRKVTHVHPRVITFFS